MTPEGKVKKMITALLKQHGVYYFMPVQTGYGKRTLDYLACHHGQFFAVEAKRPGKKATALQQMCIAEIEAVGGRCFVVDGPTSLWVLDRYLTHVTVSRNHLNASRPTEPETQADRRPARRCSGEFVSQRKRVHSCWNAIRFDTPWGH